MDNEDAFDDDLPDTLDAISEKVAHNTMRLDQLIVRLQERLSRDYMNMPILIGSLMIVGGFAHIFMRGEFFFSLVALIWGALILSLAILFRYRVATHLTRFAESLVKLDRDRQDQVRKLAVIQCLIKEGIPQEMSLRHLLVLLGEYSDENTPTEGSGTGMRPENN
ncbi:MAG: hypothetical protein O3B73_05835 [bacterium]|nr:hypothetical protein [bacterium]